MVAKLTAELLKALGHPARVLILQMLRSGQRCVCEMIPEAAMEQSNFSQHLSVLKRQGLIDCRKEGQKVMYWLTAPSVLQVLDAAQATLEEQSRSFQQHFPGPK